MKTTYTDEQLRFLFQSSFNINVWCKFLHDFFEAREIKATPEKIDTNSVTAADGYYLGNLDNDGFRIGMFYYEIKHGSVANRRVGLRNLVRSFINPRWGEFDAALVVFNSGDHWRLFFICDIKGESTSPKRYTYVFGSKELLYKTPIERFKFLQQKGISFETMKKAFSVEALSDEFFDKYREQYANFVQYVTGKRVVKVGGKWEERKMSEPDEVLISAFGYDDKKVRDYIKKMMGRITFLHFLQRKRWLCGDLNYMQNLYERSKYKDNYLDAVLEPLFFGILNTKPVERYDLFVSSSWDLALLDEWKDIPYLNGGLFERDEEDEPDSIFPAKYFSQLFQFFSEYNFTIDENDPNDAEVGVDPEMLGKIFENLLEDNKDKGAFYTPKEIVRYMCQESLIAYLETNTSIAVDKLRNFVLSPEESVVDIPQQKRPKLVEALQNVKICDPAIGSGAFPMGLLNELLRCREALSAEHYDRAELKKSIIQNNIYGVDIEKGAVDIARLRFWLSIVVDEDTPSPLPNLDYKIMQGNSLIESFEGIDLNNLVKKQIPNKNVDGIQTSILDEEIDIHQNRLSLLLSEYFTCCDHDRKVQLQNQISKSISAQLDANKINSVTLSKLKTINIAANNQFFLWHTWFADVFAKGGFDIVIGNPPYVVLGGDDYWNIQYKRMYKTANNGKTNLYKLFYEFGLKMLVQKGILSYITPNTYLTSKDSSVLRDIFFTETSLIEIIEYTEKDKVFENVTQAVTTLVLRKTFNENNEVKIRTYKQGFSLCCQKALKDCGMILPLNKVIYKMNKFKNRLSDFFDLYQGEINLTSKRNLYSDLKKDKSLLMWRGDNVGKYINQSVPFEWCLISGSKPTLYDNERIIMQQVSNQNQKFRTKAFISPKGYICGNSTNGLSPLYSSVNLKYFLALINSSAFNYYFDYFSSTNHITVMELKRIPLPSSTTEQFNLLIELVDDILLEKYKNYDADIRYLEKKIDKIVYQLYGLSNDEIKIIEQSIN